MLYKKSIVDLVIEMLLRNRRISDVEGFTLDTMYFDSKFKSDIFTCQVYSYSDSKTLRKFKKIKYLCYYSES